MPFSKKHINIQSRKIIDSFTFNNELKMLAFRLKELNDVVDYFIIVESPYTHSGKAKPLFFQENKDFYQEYLNKIIHVIVEDMPNKKGAKGINAWSNEKYQRHAIQRGINLLTLKDHDLIIITDCDEIPDSNKLAEFKKNGLGNEGTHVLLMDMYYYSLTCRGGVWWFPKILNYYDYKLRNRDPQEIRRNYNKVPQIEIEKCGWHFGYFGGDDFIINKIKSFAHQEYNKDEYLDKDNIENHINNCTDLYGRSKKLNLKKIAIKDNDYLPTNYKMLL